MTMDEHHTPALGFTFSSPRQRLARTIGRLLEPGLTAFTRIRSALGYKWAMEEFSSFLLTRAQEAFTPTYA